MRSFEPEPIFDPPPDRPRPNPYRDAENAVFVHLVSQFQPPTLSESRDRVIDKFAKAKRTAKFEVLYIWAEANLIGCEKAVVQYLANCDGQAPLADIAIQLAVGWATDSELELDIASRWADWSEKYNAVRRRVNKDLRPLGWQLAVRGRRTADARLIPVSKKTPAN